MIKPPLSYGLPEDASNQVIGQTGFALYAHTPAWGNVAHELWIRPFTFKKNP